MSNKQELKGVKCVVNSSRERHVRGVTAIPLLSGVTAIPLLSGDVSVLSLVISLLDTI